VEHELTSQIDELSTIVQQKVAFNDTGELLDFCCHLLTCPLLRQCHIDINDVFSVTMIVNFTHQVSAF